MGIGSEIGEAGGEVIGTLIGEAMARGDYEEADRLKALAASQYENIGLPGEQAVLGPSDFENVAADPRYRNARALAMDKMLGIGLEGGMDPESQAANAQARAGAAQYEASQRGAILDAQQRRGMLGAGTNVAAQLQASQAGANRVSQAGMQAAADARQRAMAALSASGNLAAGIERDDYDQRANLADRRDHIAEFNERNAQGFAQQQFGNQMRLSDAKYGAHRDRAEDYDEKGNKKVRQARGIGRAGGGAAGTIAELAAGGA